MADVIRNYKTEELINYLRQTTESICQFFAAQPYGCAAVWRQEDLNLGNDDLSILRKENISGHDFVELTKENFCSYGLKGGPATRLAKFIKGLEEKLRTYSSYKTLDDLEEMSLFEEIDDNDKAFNHCMDDIILKLSNVETMTDANEATRCEFISAILMRRSISLNELPPKWLEDLLCITEGKPHNIKIGRNGTADEAFGNEYFDYLYGIVSTGMWKILLDHYSGGT
ncbi:4921_t:CDS:2 [Paraglomus occultum]|uniref:4921_t:CDS:1 n=1 Tax=Paraglomus occultum TaxID=144539 RepID=A0A9N9FDL8_9GLOM|nr:4921_t:CDS:2 [Paraglomus occultum]